MIISTYTIERGVLFQLRFDLPENLEAWFFYNIVFARREEGHEGDSRISFRRA